MSIDILARYFQDILFILNILVENQPPKCGLICEQQILFDTFKSELYNDTFEIDFFETKYFRHSKLPIFELQENLDTELSSESNLS